MHQFYRPELLHGKLCELHLCVCWEAIYLFYSDFQFYNKWVKKQIASILSLQTSIPQTKVFNASLQSSKISVCRSSGIHKTNQMLLLCFYALAGADSSGKSYQVSHPASPATTSQAVPLHNVSKQAHQPGTEFTMSKPARWSRYATWCRKQCT